MGLSGRKDKQRIGPDPRNLSWADDASKFGQSYLSKFGWDSSQGLGADGDGRVSHIKVQQKLDMMGIGAQHQKDPNGIAWKQNKDFENVLRRLNASMGGGDGELAEEEVTALGGAFISATTAEVDGEKKKDKKEKTEKKDKKRKRNADDSDEEDSEKAKAEEPAPAVSKGKVVPRHRAHRARHIAAKNRAFNSAAAMSEILGISSESSTPTPNSESATLTKLDEPQTMEKLTVSTKSVADYFKERLLAKSASKSGTATPSNDDKEEEAPSRGGIGSSRSGLGSQRRDDEDDAPRAMGLGMSKFGSLMSSAFLASTTTIGLTPPVLAEELVEDAEAKAETETVRKDKKKRKQKDDEVDDAELSEKKRRKKEKKERKEKEQSEAMVGVEATDSAEEPKLSKEERKRLKSERKAKKLSSS